MGGTLKEDWKEREKMYACWLCSFPGMGNGQLHQLWELCGGGLLCGSADLGQGAVRQTGGGTCRVYGQMASTGGILQNKKRGDSAFDILAGGLPGET